MRGKASHVLRQRFARHVDAVQALHQQALSEDVGREIPQDHSSSIAVRRAAAERESRLEASTVGIRGCGLRRDGAIIASLSPSAASRFASCSAPPMLARCCGVVSSRVERR